MRVHVIHRGFSTYCWKLGSKQLALISQPNGSGTFPVMLSDVECFVGKKVMLSDLWIDVGVM